jgi:hypothetical protein
MRRCIGGKIKMRIDLWSAKSAPRQIVDGIDVIDLSGSHMNSEHFAVIEQALRLLEFYDPLRYHRMQQDIRRIIINDNIPTMAMFFLGTTACTIHPDLLKSGTPTVASALVHEATHARLDRRRVRQSSDRYARIETLCIKQEIAFARHFPQTDKLNEWMQRMIHHADQLRDSYRVRDDSEKG